MATSGTIGLTTFNTRKVIDHAYRGCRLPAQMITAEMQQTAIEQLGLMLAAWPNEQAPLWCQQKYILGLYEGVYSVDYFPPGTIDVMDVNLREVTRLTGAPTSTTGVAANAFDDDFATVCTLAGIVDQNITLHLTDAAIVTVVGFLPGTSGTLTYTLQYSADGVTWTTFSTATVTIVNSKWQWVDAQGIPSVAWYRIVAATASLPVSFREVVFANNASEINMARINRDDWFYLPNKFVRGRPVQFWLDRQRDGLVMNLWPSPDSASRYRQLTVMVNRQIMDVGSLQQEIEAPLRMYEAVVWNLARRLALITPEVKMDAVKLTSEMAASTLSKGWAEDRDRSPINIQIDISPYTR